MTGDEGRLIDLLNERVSGKLRKNPGDTLSGPHEELAITASNLYNTLSSDISGK